MVMRWVGHVTGMGTMRNVNNIFVGKPGEKKQFGRSRNRWEDNIRMDLREIGCEVVDWIHVAQVKDQWRTLVYIVMSILFPQKVGSILTI